MRDRSGGQPEEESRKIRQPLSKYDVNDFMWGVASRLNAESHLFL